MHPERKELAELFKEYIHLYDNLGKVIHNESYAVSILYNLKALERDVMDTLKRLDNAQHPDRHTMEEQDNLPLASQVNLLSDKLSLLAARVDEFTK